MKSPATMLLQSLASSRRLMLDSVRDLSAAELAGRPSPALRSCVRLLGMAALADREVLRLLGVAELPDLPAGFEARFARWGTRANGETSTYDTSVPEIFASHRNALVRATASLDAASFDEPVGPPDHLEMVTWPRRLNEARRCKMNSVEDAAMKAIPTRAFGSPAAVVKVASARV